MHVDKMGSFLRELLESIVIAAVITALIFIFIGRPFVIPSESMQPTLNPRDRIMAVKVGYYFSSPRRGDVVCFRYPPDPKQVLVKRLIGLPGDTVEVRGGYAFINGVPLVEPYVNFPGGPDYGPVKVPAGQYFMLGDNRANSADSRFWGFVPRKNFIGRAMAVFWPLSRAAIVR
ncbi:MAG: signal peptidase I [Chloroflexota bacterium]